MSGEDEEEVARTDQGSTSDGDPVDGENAATDGAQDESRPPADAGSGTDHRANAPEDAADGKSGTDGTDGEAVDDANGASETGPPVAAPERAAVDEAAESFVELESELGFIPADRVRGRAIDVDRVSSAAVPETFPERVTTEDALALTLVLEGSAERTVTTYFEWPDPEPGARLSRLLAQHDIAPASVADLHGRSILLEIQDNHFVPFLPTEQQRGDERAIYGVFAGLLPSLLIGLAGIFGVAGPVASIEFLLVWLVATFVVLPIAVYLDAWHVRTTADWDGGPLFWAVLAMIPGLNVLSVPAYLISRASAEPIAPRETGA